MVFIGLIFGASALSKLRLVAECGREPSAHAFVGAMVPRASRSVKHLHYNYTVYMYMALQTLIFLFITVISSPFNIFVISVG